MYYIYIYGYRQGRIVDTHLIGKATGWLKRRLRLYRCIVMLPI